MYRVVGVPEDSIQDLRMAGQGLKSRGVGCATYILAVILTAIDWLSTGYPLHRENRENGLKNPCQGKQELWKHREFVD